MDEDRATQRAPLKMFMLTKTSKVSQTGILSEHDTKAGRGIKTTVQWHRHWTAALAQNALKQEACNQILT